MRIGGIFPAGQLGTVISLGGGQILYLNAGNYLVTTGLATVLQFWDNLNNTWRGVAGPGSSNVPVNTDGTNYRLANLSGVVVGAKITSAGTGGGTNGIGAAATGVGVNFGAAPTGGRAASAYPIVGGSINTTLTITNGGSGYTTTPHIYFDPPPNGGIKATAHVSTLSAAGAITGVVVDNAGAGYTTAPNCYVIPMAQFYPGAPSGGTAAPTFPIAGTGAVITVNATLTNPNVLTGIVMTDYGQGYAGTTIPTIAFTGSLTGSPAATAIMSLSLTGTSSLVGGAGYTGGAPIFESSLGLVAATDSNNGVFLPRPARGVATIAAGAVTAFNIEDPGFGLQKVPVICVVNGGSLATTIATATATVGGIQDTCVIQGAVGS